MSTLSAIRNPVSEIEQLPASEDAPPVLLAVAVNDHCAIVREIEALRTRLASLVSPARLLDRVAPIGHEELDGFHLGAS